MGALRTIGIAVFIAGFVGMVLAAVFVGGIIPVGLNIEVGVGAVLWASLWWGPLLIVIGLVLLYVSARRRERAAVSA